MNLERRSSLKNLLLFFTALPRAMFNNTMSESVFSTKKYGLHDTDIQLTTGKNHFYIVLTASIVLKQFKTVADKYLSFIKNCFSQLLIFRIINKWNKYKFDYIQESLNNKYHHSYISLIHYHQLSFQNFRSYRKKESILSDYDLNSREHF